MLQLIPMMSEEEQLVHDIIDRQSVYCVYQPIISLVDGTIYGYEALLRGPKDSQLEAPLLLFAAAGMVSRLLELESIARIKAIEGFMFQKLPGRLFLNLSPMSLLDHNFKSGETMKLIQRLGFDASRIVIEITEHQPVNDYRLLYDAVSHYRNLGFTVALDDLGEGNSSLLKKAHLLHKQLVVLRVFVGILSTETDKKIFFVFAHIECAHSQLFN
jgi:EAL domain-containing protein (putative c-di-GMP-specific phosphodiesterase class I)